MKLGLIAVSALLVGCEAGSESSESGSDTTSGNSTIAQSSDASTVDLIIATLTGSSSGTIGLSYTINETVTNQGDGAAGGFSISYHLSSDTVLDSGDTLLGSRTLTGLSGSASDAGASSFILPATLSSGSYYLISEVDSGQEVAESDEGNNQRYSGPVTISTNATVDCDSHVPGSSISGDFVCAHNATRAAVTPAPEVALPPVRWNSHLATTAQAYAETCTWGHSDSAERKAQYENLSGESVYIGENLYASTTTTADHYAAEKAWSDEAADYDYDSNSCATGAVCGHYTQVVWRDSIEIGCGVASCGSIVNLESWSSGGLIYVCHYAPGGNYIGQKPY